MDEAVAATVREGGKILKLPCFQKGLYSGLVPSLDDNMVCEAVDDTLLVGDSELGLQSGSQNVNVAGDLLHPGHA